jgi:xanthine dehydrogenase molybdenum-binding subunit
VPETKYKLIGQNYQLNDLVAKVTGRAKYAEDFRAEGMLFAKLLLSPVPHARIRRIDTSAALAMPGVVAIITGEDVPKPQQPQQLGEAPAQRANTIPEVAIATEPMYQGEPIVAVAAVDELTATEAIEKIKVEYEPLPFVVDPMVTLRPGGPNARAEGNVWRPPQVAEFKLPESAVAELNEGRIPMLAETPVPAWEIGSVEEGFKKADLIIDETVVHQSTGHQAMEPRSAMAYWQNGKLFLHGSTQSVARTRSTVAQWVGFTAKEEDQVVIISEYTGGGFGGKIPGAHSMAIPALLSKKANGRPVLMRISREEENYIGRARPGIHLRARIGFRKDGRITAMDLCAISDCGPYANQGDGGTLASTATALYNPETIRFRGISVLTNTPPRVAQRAPGGEQASAMLEPLISKAARQLNVDQVEIRKINSPVSGSEFGPPPPPAAAGAAAAAAAASGSRAGAPAGPPAVAQPQPQELGRATGRGQAAAGQVPTQQPVAAAAPPNAPRRAFFTSCHLREALDMGAKLFNWEERKTRNGQRSGTKVTGMGVGLGTYTAGSIAMDGLLLIRPDGRVYVQTGVGNLGTGSVHDVARIVAEELDTPWEHFEIVWGDTGKHLAWSSPQAGSQTIHAHTRANLAAAQDLKKKLQEIAALELGGRPESYTVSNGRVGRLTFAQAAEAAIKRGGKFDGHESPADINGMTKASVAGLAGQGLIGVARDNFGRKGNTQSWVASFAEVEVDVETGEYRLVDYCAATDCGTVINPRGLAAQLHGGGVQGFGHIRSQKWVYDQRYGVSLANRFHYNKPPTILDIPLTEMKWVAVEIPDPQTPVGAKGIGEPAICAGAAAAICAVNAAIGDDYLRRTPATPSMIVASLDAGKRVDEGLVTHV